MSEQIRFELPNNFYIRRIDPKNWGICKEKEKKEGGQAETVLGYYSDFFEAGKASLRIVTNASKDMEELKQSMIEFKMCMDNMDKIIERGKQMDK
jgi:hypothetical protein